MKFRCERDVLAQSLATVSRAVTGRAVSIPALSGVFCEVHAGQLRLVGSDRQLTIEAEMPVAADADGTTVLPARLFTDIVVSLGAGAVIVAAGDDTATIAAGRSQFVVRTLPTEEFPQLPAPPEDAVSIDAQRFAAALRQVIPAASRDDARPILTGVLMAAEAGGLRLVATDSYRLAVRDLLGMTVLGEEQKVLVPWRALDELRRLLGEAETVTARLGEQHAVFEVDNVRLTTVLIQGEFPNYRQLIPSSYPNRLAMSRAALLDAIRRVRMLAHDGVPVRLTMGPDVCMLHAITHDIGEAHEELDATYEGSELTIAFNPEFLAHGVEGVTDDDVVIETVDPLKIILVRPRIARDYLYLLMPIRLPESLISVQKAS